MRPSILLPLVCGLAVMATAQTPAPELPSPELTEYYTPVPPVVSAPAGKPPSDAIVLFDGSSTREWEPVTAGRPVWSIVDGAFVVGPFKDEVKSDMRTKRGFGDVQLHIEFRTPAKVEGKGQGRGNSGIFLMGLYELQVLDSYENATYVNGQAGSIYKQHPPLVNASRPPGEWQSYDVVFVAPRFNADGTVASPARVTAFHNGVLIQHDVVLAGPTEYRGPPKYRAHADKLPITLQNHNNPTAFRNIWVREIALPR